MSARAQQRRIANSSCNYCSFSRMEKSLHSISNGHIGQLSRMFEIIPYQSLETKLDQCGLLCLINAGSEWGAGDKFLQIKVMDHVI